LIALESLEGLLHLDELYVPFPQQLVVDGFWVINVMTGEYEMDADNLRASELARERFGESLLYKVRIGYETTSRLGGRFRAKAS